MKYICLLIFLITHQFAFSQQNDFIPIKNKHEIEQKLNNHSLKLNTIYSDFIQEKHLAYLNDIIISKGKFWFKKENQLRWEYNTPYKYIIALNHGTFTIKDGDDIKEYDINSNKAFQEVNNMIISSVRGTLLKDNKFTISLYQNKSSYLVKLIPKNKEMTKVLKAIELYFSKSDLNIFKVKMIENEDDYTVISFTNKKINETIPANIFNLN